jgi:hypothetical protein
MSLKLHGTINIVMKFIKSRGITGGKSRRERDILQADAAAVFKCF